jgi:hypothetical protein
MEISIQFEWWHLQVAYLVLSYVLGIFVIRTWVGDRPVDAGFAACFGLLWLLSPVYTLLAIPAGAVWLVGKAITYKRER